MLRIVAAPSLLLWLVAGTAPAVAWDKEGSPTRTPTPAPTPAPTGRKVWRCAPGETAVVVDTGKHRLHLCHDGTPEETFVVALGVSGVDKRRAGDNRTPLGAYGLGSPRGSQQFHRFIPVGYPTVAQQRAGFTGSAIGIHGPPRGFEPATRLAALVETDWTAGCIAVGTDAEIDRIVAWVAARQVRTVRLIR